MKIEYTSDSSFYLGTDYKICQLEITPVKLGAKLL